MEPKDPQSRKEYRHRNHQLTRNTALTASPNRLKKGNAAARLLSLIAVISVSFVVAYGAHVYFSAMSSAGKAYQQGGQVSAKISQKQPVSVLILGVDQGIEGRHDQGNSDTMILATANPAKKSATMTSIPRDLLTDVKGDDGKYFLFRVNSAYQVGGNQASVKTVEALLNTPVDYYMEVNMQALESLVDAVGGVTVNVPFAFTYNTTFHKGEMHLNGKEALDYARMRKEDPRGDYGRQLRQRQIIEAIVHEAMSLKTLSNYRRILNVFSKYVKTNMTFSDMMNVALNYRDCAKNLKSGYIQGHDAWIGGAAIQVASTKELQRVSDLTRGNLGLPRQTLSNEETRQNHLNSVHAHLDWKDPNAFTNYVIYQKDSDTQAWQGGGDGQ